MLEIGKKIVAFVIDDDERREILDVDLADGLHTQLGEVHDLDRFDGVLGQDRRRAADRTEVRTAVFLQASVTCCVRLPFATITSEPPSDWNRST